MSSIRNAYLQRMNRKPFQWYAPIDREMKLFHEIERGTQHNMGSDKLSFSSVNSHWDCLYFQQSKIRKQQCKGQNEYKKVLMLFECCTLTSLKFQISHFTVDSFGFLHVQHLGL